MILRRRTAMAGGLMLGIALLGGACSRRDATPALLFEPPAATGGDGAGSLRIQFSDKPVMAPAFSVAGLDGKTINSADWRGKVVLVNFWATWCGPCREEIPVLVALQERYRDRLLIVGLSIDERPAAEVQAFVADHRINYPVAIADERVQQAFGGITAVPATYVVNPDGGIVQRHMGLTRPFVSEQEVRALAGLPIVAKVETVKDTGQVLLANAAYATEIPGLSLSTLTPAQREEVLRRLNTEKCTCGCGLTMAQCRINDPSCVVSLPAAQKVVKSVVGAMPKS
jgi:thiol-disulfide isomerase/thioredoxin